MAANIYFNMGAMIRCVCMPRSFYVKVNQVLGSQFWNWFLDHLYLSTYYSPMPGSRSPRAEITGYANYVVDQLHVDLCSKPKLCICKTKLCCSAHIVS